ncbi:MAG TPA: hypothetical protein DEH05_02530 [Propionibacteriaceae bacterium]|nr:hypothetical protein [Propionibacteriaceae bacterium]
MDEAQLVILHPSTTHARGDTGSAAFAFAHDAFERRGTAQRAHRNLVVFLAADSKRMDELTESVRHYLAWKWIEGRKVELDLSPAQVTQVMANVTRNDEDVDARIGQTYQWALVPVQDDPARPPSLTVERADGAATWLAERVSDRLGRAGLLTTSLAARTVRLELDQHLRSVWERGHVSVGELWGYYSRYPYLTRVRDRSVLVDAVESTLGILLWQVEGFALADSYDSTNGRYSGLVIPSGDARFGQITDSTLLVSPAVALAQTSSAPVDQLPGGHPAVASAGEMSSGVLTASVDEVPQGPRRPTRFVGVYAVDPERYARDLTRVSQEVLQQLAATPGIRLDITLEIQASANEGFDDARIRVVAENARTLRFTHAAFEEE